MCLGAMRLLAAFFEPADVLGLHLPGNREIREIIAADDFLGLYIDAQNMVEFMPSQGGIETEVRALPLVLCIADVIDTPHSWPPS